MTSDVRRARTAFLWVGVLAPLAIIAIASVIIATWLPELPDPVATHWGVNGVNGYGPGWTYLALMIGMGGGVVVLLAVMALFGSRLPPHAAGAETAQQWSPTARLLGAMSLAVTSTLAVDFVISVGAQRGLANSADAPNITPWVLLLLLVLAGLGVLGWALQPTVTATQTDQVDHAAYLALAPGQKVAWFGTATMGRVGIISVTVAMVVLIGVTIWVALLDPASGWIMATVTLLTLVLIGTCLVFRVRINAAGLRVRSIAGWPRWSIPAAEITDVKVVQVTPMAEFGGWGVRFAVDGRVGIVLRTGEGLQVARRRGRTLVVTINDADTAASVLNTVREASNRGETA